MEGNTDSAAAEPPACRMYMSIAEALDTLKLREEKSWMRRVVITNFFSSRVKGLRLKFPMKAAIALAGFSSTSTPSVAGADIATGQAGGSGARHRFPPSPRGSSAVWLLRPPRAQQPEIVEDTS